MPCIILNEWILNEIGGDNGRAAQLEAFEFLQALIRKPDRIAVLLGSPWMSKAYRLMKHHDPKVLELGKLLNQGLLLDQNKSLLLSTHDLIALPEELGQIDLKHDKYLFDLYYSAKADMIVTSDMRLIEKVATVQDLTLVPRDRFLADYLN